MAAAGDPTFPGLHIRPEQGWLNDPNGVCRVDGVYHVFFQYNPHAPLHRDICWGHASSPDLLHWTYEPVALRPRPGKIDAAGCWSGSITLDDGVPTALYSAVPDHAWNAEVVLARSDRTLRVWQQEETSAIGPPSSDGVTEARDPFVFEVAGHRYGIQGAGQRNGRPEVLLYGCDDLTRWTALGALLTDDDPVAAEVAPANIWECPNVFQVDGHWVLLLSVWRSVNDTNELVGVRYLLGDIVPAGAGLRFQASSGGVVDDGPTFYAPQALVEPNRVLLWGWAWEQDRSEQQVTQAGWAGVLTFPRELHVVDGALVPRPAAELTGLRAEPLDWTPDGFIGASAFEVEAVEAASLWLVDGTGERCVATIAPGGRAFVDGSLVEVFGSGPSTTTRAYPSGTSRWQLRGAAATLWRLSL